MVNYNNGKIYKIEPIVDHPEGDIYIGSTTKQYLSQRMDNHRCNFKRWQDGKYHKFTVYDLFDKYGVENCKIYLLETINCNTKDELLAREGHYIKTLKCVNKAIPGRTMKEWYNENKQKLSEYKKEYAEDHKEKISEYQKQYRNDNKERLSENRKIKVHCDICNCDITKSHLLRHNRTLTHQNNLNL
jgi:hypothetical protein